MSVPIKSNTKAERLDNLIRQWVFSTVHAVDLEKFMTHFTPLTPGHEKDLRNALVQGLNWFKIELEKLSDTLKEDYDLSTKTSHLEKLTEEARQFPPINTNTILNNINIPTPNQAMLGVKANQNLELLEQLQNELKKLKEDNYNAMKRHLELSRQIVNKRKRIENLLQEFDKMIEEIQTIPNEELLDLMNELDVHAIIKQAL